MKTLRNIGPMLIFEIFFSVHIKLIDYQCFGLFSGIKHGQMV